MYGAFIGDIVGSKYELHNIKTKDFPLFSEGCSFTDDSILTAAVALSISLSSDEQSASEPEGGGNGFQHYLTREMQKFGRRYPRGGYGGRFISWISRKHPKPYGSYGNGSAMRVSPCGLAAVTLEEALALARASACITHNHPEGIKGAEATAAAVYLAKAGKTKEEIRRYIAEHYYNLDFTLDGIRERYRFDVSCQGSVPQAIEAFLESEDFEDTIRNAISIGGDSDTIGAIAGSIAWVYYAQSGAGSDWYSGRFDPAMERIRARAAEYLPGEFLQIEADFHQLCRLRAETYSRTGACTPILNQAEWEKYGNV